jgi:hypothetical protein
MCMCASGKISQPIYVLAIQVGGEASNKIFKLEKGATHQLMCMHKWTKWPANDLYITEDPIDLTGINNISIVKLFN